MIFNYKILLVYATKKVKALADKKEGVNIFF